MAKTSWMALFFCLAGAGFAETALELNARGIEMLEAERYREAVTLFESARRRQPGDPAIKSNHAAALNAWGVALGEARDYTAAERRLEQSLKIEPGAETVHRNLLAIRIHWGASLTDAGRYPEAERKLISAYETATEKDKSNLDRRRSDNYVLEAQARLQASDDARAETALLKALEFNPGSLPALMELGNLSYAQGDGEAALGYWIEAEKIQPDLQGLSAIIDKAIRERETEGDFDSRSSQRFLITYEGRENRKASSEVLRILNKAYHSIGSDLNCRPKRRLGVVIYTRDQYSDVTLAPHWTGALYDGKIRVPLSEGDLENRKNELLREMLWHEYTHAVVHDLAGMSAPNIPAWFNEGLASYFELERKEREIRQRSEMSAVKRLAAKGHSVSVRGLPARFTQIEDADQARQAYLVSRTFVAWLARNGRSKRFKTVLAELNAGETIEAAIEEAFNKSLERLEEDWLRDLRRH